LDADSQITAFGRDVSWSPDGREIAYESGGRIWAASLGGGTPRVVATNLDAIPHDLSWSPDGSRIAFTATKNLNPELWLMEDFIHLVKAPR
jgi:Tol biopolymer transport system component